MKKFMILLLPLVLLLNAGIALAQTPVPPDQITDDQVNEVAKTLYCPVCENISLDVCPTQACAQWRDVIRQKLAEGLNKQEIEEYFALHYGDRVLAEPPRSGWHWLIYILPVVALGAGAWIVYRILRPKPHATDQPAHEEAPAKPVDPYLKRMEDDLKKRMK